MYLLASPPVAGGSTGRPYTSPPPPRSVSARLTSCGRRKYRAALHLPSPSPQCICSPHLLWQEEVPGGPTPPLPLPAVYLPASPPVAGGSTGRPYTSPPPPRSVSARLTSCGRRKYRAALHLPLPAVYLLASPPVAGGSTGRPYTSPSPQCICPPHLLWQEEVPGGPTPPLPLPAVYLLASPPVAGGSTGRPYTSPSPQCICSPHLLWQEEVPGGPTSPSPSPQCICSPHLLWQEEVPGGPTPPPPRSVSARLTSCGRRKYRAALHLPLPAVYLLASPPVAGGSTGRPYTSPLPAVYLLASPPVAGGSTGRPYTSPSPQCICSPHLLWQEEVPGGPTSPSPSPQCICSPHLLWQEEVPGGPTSPLPLPAVYLLASPPVAGGSTGRPYISLPLPAVYLLASPPVAGGSTGRPYISPPPPRSVSARLTSCGRRKYRAALHLPSPSPQCICSPHLLWQEEVPGGPTSPLPLPAVYLPASPPVAGGSTGRPYISPSPSPQCICSPHLLWQEEVPGGPTPPPPRSVSARLTSCGRRKYRAALHLPLPAVYLLASPPVAGGSTGRPYTSPSPQCICSPHLLWQEEVPGGPTSPSPSPQCICSPHLLWQEEVPGGPTSPLPLPAVYLPASPPVAGGSTGRPYISPSPSPQCICSPHLLWQEEVPGGPTPPPPRSVSARLTSCGRRKYRAALHLPLPAVYLLASPPVAGGSTGRPYTSPSPQCICSPHLLWQEEVPGGPTSPSPSPQCICSSHLLWQEEVPGGPTSPLPLPAVYLPASPPVAGGSTGRPYISPSPSPQCICSPHLLWQEEVPGGPTPPLPLPAVYLLASPPVAGGSTGRPYISLPLPAVYLLASPPVAGGSTGRPYISPPPPRSVSARLTSCGRRKYRAALHLPLPAVYLPASPPVAGGSTGRPYTSPPPPRSVSARLTSCGRRKYRAALHLPSPSPQCICSPHLLWQEEVPGGPTPPPPRSVSARLTSCGRRKYRAALHLPSPSPQCICSPHLLWQEEVPGGPTPPLPLPAVYLLASPPVAGGSTGRRSATC